MIQDSRRGVFSRRVLAWLVVAGCAAFCAMLVLLVAGDPATAGVTKSSVFSRSALGHSALAELLKARGHEVRVNRGSDAARIGEADLVLVLEPAQREDDIAALSRLLEKARATARPVLVALPKRVGVRSRRQRGWIERAILLPAARAARIARALPLDDPEVARLVDDAASPTWRGLDADAAPRLDDVQLLEAEALRPLVAAGEGILLGAVARPNTYVLADTLGDVDAVELKRIGGELYVLADPDLLANHGLHRGANARIVLTAIERLLPERGVVVFDETLHGFAITPNLWRLLFQPPHLAATLLALAALALTVWHAAARFGAPLVDAPGPAFRGGHGTLIENAGRLLTAGGHDAVVARRYGEAIVADALGRLRLAPALGGGDATATLNAIGARRGLRARLPADNHRHRPLALARRYQRWAREMFDDA